MLTCLCLATQPGYWAPLPGELAGDFTGCASSDMQRCAAGYYGARPDYTDPTCEALCTRGHYCTRGTEDPTPCPPGSFMAVEGAPSIGSCSFCGAGQYGNQSASTSCQVCPSGRFNEDVNQTSCIACPSGGAELPIWSLHAQPRQWGLACLPSRSCPGLSLQICCGRLLPDRRCRNTDGCDCVQSRNVQQHARCIKQCHVLALP